MADLGVLSISIVLNEVMLTDGQLIPITNWLLGDKDAVFDENGDGDADRWVAGPDADGNWHAGLLQPGDED